MPVLMSLEGPRIAPGSQFRGHVRAVLADLIPGGRAAGRSPASFDQTQLAIGTRVEMEHTNDPNVAREIAMDHLVEDPNYYIKLHSVHLDGLGFFAPIAAHPITAIVGLVFGAWLAGTSRGRAFVSKHTRKR